MNLPPNAGELRRPDANEETAVGGDSAYTTSYVSPGLVAGERSDAGRAVELKFIVDLPTAEQIRSRAGEELLVDPFANSDTATYGVSSYYLDTLEFDIYHRTQLLNGTKYRFRNYDAGSEVFLERKVRRQGIVSKQRYPVNLQELRDRQALTLPVWAEIGEFCLAPSMSVHYTRSAYFKPNVLTPFRVTIDVDLTRHSYRTDDPNLPSWTVLSNDIAESRGPRNKSESRIPMLVDRAVVEFKFMDSLPKQLISWLEDFKIAPIKFSKYRNAVNEFHREAEIV